MTDERELPSGWCISPLVDLLECLESGSRPKGGVSGIKSGVPSVGGEHLNSSGGFKLEHMRYVPEEYADGMLRGHIQPSDILVVKDGATTGKTAFVGKSFPYSRAVVNEHVFLCRCNRKIDPTYVFYYLLSDRGNQEILEDFRGAAQGGISQRFADLVKVPLAPVAEQARIVEKLEELLSDLDAGVAELKTAQKKLAQYRQSLLKAAVEGALTAEWRQSPAAQKVESGADLLQRILRERRARWEARQLARFQAQGKSPPKDWQAKYPEPVVPDTTDLPELPQGWVWTSLDSLIEEGPQNGLYLPATSYGRGCPILRIDDFQIGWVRPRDELNLVDADAVTVSNYQLCAGDVVINRVNSMTHLGKSLVVSDEIVGALFESNMMRARLTALVDSEYVGLYLGSEIGRKRLIRDAKWAVNQASINQQDVKKTPVPISSLTEQCEITRVASDQLAASQEQLNAISYSLRQAIAQRKNVLQAAFSGQLVPQSTGDEPAGVLLERIRAERAARQTKATSRRRSAQVI